MHNLSGCSVKKPMSGAVNLGLPIDQSWVQPSQFFQFGGLCLSMSPCHAALC